jgi:hypothetical protein
MLSSAENWHSMVLLASSTMFSRQPRSSSHPYFGATPWPRWQEKTSAAAILAVEKTSRSQSFSTPTGDATQDPFKKQ